MPTRLPICPRCQSNLYVRVEWILSGRRVSGAYYCGHCHHEWLVEAAGPVEAGERRTAQRRKLVRVETKRRP